jgi:hypothetical protein
MLPLPITHEWTMEGEHYKLVEWTRGGEKRLRAEYAMAISASPAVIESVDGQDLYLEAVARECLKEAPDVFWDTRPANAQTNGTPQRVVTFEQVPRALWALFVVEVNAFLGKIFPAAAAEPQSGTSPGPATADPVAALETVPALPRGRAE